MHAIAVGTALLFAFTSLFDDLPATAVAQSPVVDGQPAVTLRLVSDEDVWAPGHAVRVGVQFELNPGWHIYGANPGGAGFPTAIDWNAGLAQVGPTVYPAPQTFKESDAVFTYGYAGRVLLTAPVQLPASIAVGDALTVTAKVRFLACKIICAPGEVTLQRQFALAATPQPVLAQSDAGRAFAAPLSTPEAPANGTAWATPPGRWRSLGEALVLAFLGGLILNAMPCVLPVLALKAMGLVQARNARAQATAHALSYAAGVMGSMAILAGAVLAVRAAGHSVGWGFQFQEPLFIAGVAVCMLLFACNCFGLFEVMPDVNRVAQAHAQATGLRRSVLEGVLAVAVATPCSAPFLGTAVAFALGQAAPVVVAVFLTIGAGLATPWVALVMAPGLAQRLPRPGAWMGRLKIIMGFGLLATVVWLVWLFGRVRAVDDMAALLLLLWATGVLAWITGVVSAAQPQRLAPLLIATLAALAGLGHELLGGNTSRAELADHAAAQAPFSDARVQAELAAGHPVLVDFTADWCITCKYNEHHVLNNARIVDTLRAHRVTVLRADWTRRDASLLAVLMRHGRAGVPMYLLYRPDAPQSPQLLPEVLTVATVLEAVAPL